MSNVHLKNALARLLLVEDDLSLGATLKENLELEGYDVEWLQSGVTVTNLVLERPFDLAVMDVMLPTFSGFEILSELRKVSQLPVLLISARGQSHDRIQGLSLEADDYLSKPFHFKELLLRIQAILRRSQKHEAEVSGLIHVGHAIIDVSAHAIERDSGEKEILSPKEMRLLALLLKNANTVISRQEIMDLVWGKEKDASPRTIDNLIVKLRKLIETDPSQPQHIISHRGIGYSLRRQV